MLWLRFLTLSWIKWKSVFFLILNRELSAFHHALQCYVHVLSCFSHVWLFATPWTVAHQAPLSSGFSKQGYWSGWPCPPPGDLPYSEIEPMTLRSPALAGEFFTTSDTWELQCYLHYDIQFGCSVVSNSATPWIAACQASLSITNPRSLLKLMSIECVMPSSHLILCHPIPLLPPIPPSIRVFSNDSTLCMRWPKYWSFRFNISPSNKHPGLISFRMD